MTDELNKWIAAESRRRYWRKVGWGFVTGVLAVIIVLLFLTMTGCGLMQTARYTDPITGESFVVKKDDGTYRTNLDDWISTGTAIVGGIVGLGGTGAAIKYGLGAATATRALGNVTGHMETALNMLPETDRKAITGRMEAEHEELGVVKLVQKVRGKPVKKRET